MPENIITEVISKFKTMQTIVVDADGRVVPYEQQLSKHKRIQLKDFVLESGPRQEQQLLRSAETLAAMIKDLREWTTCRFDVAYKTNQEKLSTMQTEQETSSKSLMAGFSDL